VRRVAELDGLRGVAVVLVVAGHLITGIGPYPRPGFGDLGGDLFQWADSAGVQLFFALSGYLITSLLLRELGAAGSLDLRGFWIRRLRRLYPPLIAVCMAYLVVMLLLPWTRGHDWTGVAWAGLGDIGLALTYTGNVAWLWVPRSGWLGHTWSLAVEEQFYLLWPLVVLAVVGRFRPRALVPVIAAGTLFTIAARSLVPESVVEAGLRWDALLVGALVAVLGWRTPRSLTVAALAAFAVLCVVDLPIENVFYSVTAACAALIVGGAHHLHWLTNGVLVHLGHISYGLYLWHVFVLRFAPPWWTAVPLSLGAAELSHRLIERRFMANPPPLRRPKEIDLRERSLHPGRRAVPR